MEILTFRVIVGHIVLRMSLVDSRIKEPPRGITARLTPTLSEVNMLVKEIEKVVDALRVILHTTSTPRAYLYSENPDVSDYQINKFKTATPCARSETILMSARYPGVDPHLRCRRVEVVVGDYSSQWTFDVATQTGAWEREIELHGAWFLTRRWCLWVDGAITTMRNQHDTEPDRHPLFRVYATHNPLEVLDFRYDRGEWFRKNQSYFKRMIP